MITLKLDWFSDRALDGLYWSIWQSGMCPAQEAACRVIDEELQRRKDEQQSTQRDRLHHR
jgi:hypothetical protein